ncbi:hypothetical protein [Actinomadura sp. K4S16]|nr:hypothetical protein [Actinomadura sp. K4S16]
MDECELCEEPFEQDEDEMPDGGDIGHFIRGGKTIVAHGQCGLDAGLRLA